MEETRARATRLLLDVRARYRARSSTVDDALMDYLLQRLDASTAGTPWPSVRTVAAAHGVNYFTLRNRLSRLATPAAPRHDVRDAYGRWTQAGVPDCPQEGG